MSLSLRVTVSDRRPLRRESDWGCRRPRRVPAPSSLAGWPAVHHSEDVRSSCHGDSRSSCGCPTTSSDRVCRGALAEIKDWYPSDFTIVSKYDHNAKITHTCESGKNIWFGFHQQLNIDFSNCDSDYKALRSRCSFNTATCTGAYEDCSGVNDEWVRWQAALLFCGCVLPSPSR